LLSSSENQQGGASALLGNDTGAVGGNKTTIVSAKAPVEARDQGEGLFTATI
jgi:hypothetical protein